MVDKKRFVALGDSYTFCQGVDRKEEWNFFFFDDKPSELEFVKSLAYNGWTAETLWKNCIKADTLKNYKPEFCTLLIGVNDWFDGVAIEVFVDTFRLLCSYITVDCNAELLVFGIPNFLVTTEGKGFCVKESVVSKKGEYRLKDGRTIEMFNEQIKHVCLAFNIPFVELRDLQEDDFHIDGLHLSVKGNKHLAELLSSNYRKINFYNGK